jgi:hypothetical protein
VTARILRETFLLIVLNSFIDIVEGDELFPTLKEFLNPEYIGRRGV